MDDEAGVGTVSGRLEKEDKKMKTVDMELILLCALIAAIGAFGLVTGHESGDGGEGNDPGTGKVNKFPEMEQTNRDRRMPAPFLF